MADGAINCYINIIIDVKVIFPLAYQLAQAVDSEVTQALHEFSQLRIDTLGCVETFFTVDGGYKHKSFSIKRFAFTRNSSVAESLSLLLRYRVMLRFKYFVVGPGIS